MSDFFEIIGNVGAAKRTLLFTFGFLFAFIVLMYLYIISTKKDNAEEKNKKGVLAMSFIFFFYIMMGLLYILNFDYSLPDQEGAYKLILFLLSGCINICFLFALPFFSRGVTKLDQWSEDRLWNYVAIFIGIFYLAVAMTFKRSDLVYADLPVTTIIMFIVGIFVSWDFERRDMKFMGYLIAALLMAKILLQWFTPIINDGDSQDKFRHINLSIFFPAMVEAIVAIMVVFNWINGLRYKDLAKIYSTDTTDTSVQEYFDKKSTLEDLKKDWNKKIMKNEVEGAIQSMILFLEKRNEHFELILSIASRNNRNNTGQMKGLLSTDEYNRSRNKIMEALIELIGKI